MLLNYIWIKNFKNIHNKGFKFSDVYNIDYDSELAILNIEQNTKHIDNFFPGNIKAISAIIGANGAGKSNLFEYLKYTLASFGKGASASFEYESIIIFDKDIFYQKKIKIANKHQLTGKGFSFFEYSDSLAPYMNDDEYEYALENPDRVYENAYIYYSSIFDLRSEYRPFELVDISTNSLVFSESYTQRFRIDTNLNPYHRKIDDLNAFEVAEVDRQIEFVSDNYFKLPIAFPLPKYISIRIDEEYNSYLVNKNDFFKEHELKEFDKLEWYFYGSNNAENIDFIQTYKRIFIYKLLIILQVNDPELYKGVTEVQFSNIVYNNNLSIFDSIYSEEKAQTIQELLNSFDRLMGFAEPVMSEHDKEFFKKYDTIELSYNETTSAAFINFFTLYKTVIYGKDFLTFSWGGLSSGELTILNFYSRLYYAIRKYQIEDCNHIVIMIDEGETSLHPVWQMKFLDNVISFLNAQIPDKTVQLIATSHSPFLISNLPKSMINFLDRDEEGNCIVVDGLTEVKQTFGANINTLYTDSFFMRQTLMGDFAKKKLDRLINVVNGEKDFDEEFPNWDIIQRYIDIIGEPIVKGMLQRQLQNHLMASAKDVAHIKNQIKTLEDRLKNLEKGNDTN